jgi:hypothetical protein
MFLSSFSFNLVFVIIVTEDVSSCLFCRVINLQRLSIKQYTLLLDLSMNDN